MEYMSYQDCWGVMEHMYHHCCVLEYKFWVIALQLLFYLRKFLEYSYLAKIKEILGTQS